jgi:hypothetical protein
MRYQYLEQRGKVASRDARQTRCVGAWGSDVVSPYLPLHASRAGRDSLDLSFMLAITWRRVRVYR